MDVEILTRLQRFKFICEMELCILCDVFADNECTYNDPTGLSYRGGKSMTNSGRQCGAWSLQRAYPADQIADKSLDAASNFCRNPLPQETRTWCYWYISGNQKKWEFCTLRQCGELCVE